MCLCGHILVSLLCLSLYFCLDRAGSISTLDSLDFARYSDDGNRESDERVAGEMSRTVRTRDPAYPGEIKRWTKICIERERDRICAGRIET